MEMRLDDRKRPSYLPIAAVLAAVLISLVTACANAMNGSGPPYTVTYRNTTVATTGSVPVDPTRYAAGSTVTVMGNTGPLTWPGFTFTGWDSQDNGGLDGGGGGTFYTPGQSFMINSDITLYGTWVSGP